MSAPSKKVVITEIHGDYCFGKLEGGETANIYIPRIEVERGGFIFDLLQVDRSIECQFTEADSSHSLKVIEVTAVEGQERVFRTTPLVGELLSGTVKFYNYQHQFGFVRVTSRRDIADVYIGKAESSNPDVALLQKGTVISFTVGESDHASKVQAIDISVIDEVESIR